MAQGSFVAQSGMAQNIILKASKSQTIEPASQTADTRVATGSTVPSLCPLAPHSDLEGMVSQSLTPHMGKLNIAHGRSEWERDKCSRTAAGGNFFPYVASEVMEKQDEGNGSGSIEGKSFYLPNQSSVVNTEVNWGRNSLCIKGRKEVVGTSESDYEVRLLNLMLYQCC